jgi:hypothetical protein
MIVTGLALLGLGVAFRKKAMEYILDRNQENHIKQLHPKCQELFRRFIAGVERLGYKVIVTTSYRTFAEQLRLKKENPKNATPGLSHHNYGMAIDINLLKGIKWWKKATPKAEWEATGVPQLARSMGLQWGGDYADYHDPIHFNVKYDTNLLRQLAISQFGPDETKIQGNKVLIV